MAEIINLKQARKSRARRAKDQNAAARRAEFGTPKVEKLRTKAMREQDAEKIASHKLDDEND